MARNSAGILWLSKIDRDDAAIVGDKAASLGDLARSGLPIPDGFIITSSAYFQFFSHQNLRETITQLLSTTSFDRPESVMQVSQLIRKQIREAPFPNELLHEIDISYQKLSGLLKHMPVAIRPSPMTMDLFTPAFVGGTETILGNKGEANLILHLREIWASLFSPAALLAREEQHVSHFKMGIAVLVQKMVNGEHTGILFTIDPVEQDKDVLIIEATSETEKDIPEQYIVAKKDLRVVARKTGKKPVLTDNQVMDLAVIGKKISQHTYFPQEIAWSLNKTHLFVLSAKNLPAPTTNKEKAPSTQLPLLAKGMSASKGMYSGHIRLVTTAQDIQKLLPGEILVLANLDQHFLSSISLIKKAGALIADTGGKTAQLTHVFRELGIPAVVGTENATSLLHAGQVVTVNGTTGEVYKGTMMQHPTTATKVYINLAQAVYADIAAESNADGVGLLCPDCLMADLGIYRHAFVQDGKAQEYSEKLAEHLSEVCQVFVPHLVMYEAKYQEPEFFSLEVAALQIVHKQKKARNLGIVLSAIRTVDDLRDAKKVLAAAGLSRSTGVKIWMMVETPAQVVLLDQFIEAGLDGVTIGSQTLAMLVLGTDEIADIDERHPAVLWAIEQTIRTANKHHILSSFCGQAASLYPSLLKKLIEWGITSISVAPSIVETVREQVAKAERELVESRFTKKKH